MNNPEALPLQIRGAAQACSNQPPTGWGATHMSTARGPAAVGRALTRMAAWDMQLATF